MDAESIKTEIIGKRIKDFNLNERAATIDDLNSIADGLDQIDAAAEAASNAAAGAAAKAEAAANKSSEAMEKAEAACLSAGKAYGLAESALDKGVHAFSLSENAMKRSQDALETAVSADLKSQEADRIHDGQIADMGGRLRGLSDALSGIQLTDVQVLEQMKDVVSQIITAFGGKVRRTTTVSFDTGADDKVTLEVPVRTDGSIPAGVVWN